MKPPLIIQKALFLLEELGKDRQDNCVQINEEDLWQYMVQQARISFPQKLRTAFVAGAYAQQKHASEETCKVIAEQLLRERAAPKSIELMRIGSAYKALPWS